jgi:hypothetical protein
VVQHLTEAKRVLFQFGQTPILARRDRARGTGNIAFALAHLVEQLLSLLQIERVETLGEPAADRSEQITGFIPLALIAPETGEAGGGRSFRGTAPCPSQLLAELEGT